MINRDLMTAWVNDGGRQTASVLMKRRWFGWSVTATRQDFPTEHSNHLTRGGAMAAYTQLQGFNRAYMRALRRTEIRLD